VGGLITDRASWRWCFWFPLPIGVFASILLVFTLNLNPHGGESLRYHLAQFDALGLALIIGGVTCALLGLTISQTRGEMVHTIAMTVVGACLLLAAAIWEVFTKRSPIIPPRLFQVCDASSPLEPARLNVLDCRQGRQPLFCWSFLFMGSHISRVSKSSNALEIPTIAPGYYYLPIYFEVLEGSATKAGLR
jgi:MFS family permease